MRDLRADRSTGPALVDGGKFDLAGIMQRAIATARSIRVGGLSWARRLSIGLRSAWAKAKASVAAKQLRNFA